MKVDSSSWRDPNDSDQVAQVYVLKDNRVLILQRSNWLGWAPNQWALPGGHIEFGEDFEKGAIRELKEETDLDIVSMVHFESDDNLHYYIVKEFKGKIRLNNEHTGWFWAREEDLDHYDIVPTVKKRIKKLFNTMR